MPGRREQPYAWMKSWSVAETQPAYTWLRANPHRFSLSRIGLTFADGEALDFAKIADTHPSIIFVDIMMPRLDGYQTCALIKNNSAFKSTPVIMLSSKDGLFDKAKGRIVGSDQYLTKPFSKEELLGAIKTHVPDFVPVEQAS